MSGSAEAAAAVSVQSVTIRIDGVEIVARASIEALSGAFVGLIGPNGSGKSTLLKSVYRSLRPAAGLVSVGAADVWRMAARDAARRTAVVAQESSSDFEFTVREVVAMGRSPHKRLFERDGADDVAIVDDALSQVGMASFDGRLYSTLSGGEKQRVLLARCLAQRSTLLVLDEPTNHLDVRAQFELLDLVRSLGVTALAALHDLNLAARYCDRIFVLRSGGIVADGAPADVLTPELLADVFGVDCRCEFDPASGRLQLSMLGVATGSASPRGPDRVDP